MILIVGLGNKGKEYNLTRHNIGFEAIDYLANKYNIEINKSKKKGIYGQGIIEGEKVLLVKPTTYMNLSGECVLEFKDYYDIEISDIIVIYDDIDLPLGSLRIRKKGSAGSHNGMKNIIYLLKDDGFPRFRLGIGKNEKIELKNYVLSKFSQEERALMKEAVIKASEGIAFLLKHDIDYAMNMCNEKKEKKNKKKEEDEKNE